MMSGLYSCVCQLICLLSVFLLLVVSCHAFDTQRTICTVVCFHNTNKKTMFTLISTLNICLLFCMQTNYNRVWVTFDLSLSHASCVSVDAFAHIHCWCGVSMWSHMAVGFVWRNPCSHWNNTPHWRSRPVQEAHLMPLQLFPSWMSGDAVMLSELCISRN